jgi:prepilin-type N-terminal cleavage/methylation domain-containing protein
MRRTPRPGYTLLEVLLASVISVMLLAALYVTMESQLRSTRDGREVVERSALIRAVLARLSTDLTPCLTSLGTPAESSSSSGTSGAAAGGTGAGTNGGTGGGGGTAPPAGTGTGGAAAPAMTTTTTPGTLGPILSFGVQGDISSLTILVSRPTRVPAGVTPEQAALQAVGDLRRITYWVTDAGLARNESLEVTDDTGAAVAALVDDPGQVLAPEVKTLQFRYFDGTNWLEYWDGTLPGPDGVTPQGPPRAVEVTVGVGVADDPAVPLKTVRHVIAIPTANGTATADAGTAP